VTERNLAPRGRTGLDGVLPVGSRAIRVDVAGALVPRVGAAVDVLASYSGTSTSTDPSTGEATGDTVVVAAGALVLGTDHDGTRGTARTGAGVTLLVDVGEARDLADAQANGVLTIALVPPEGGHAVLVGIRSVASGRHATGPGISLSTLHAIILGIVQGLTEFLPISSSGHLILVPELFGWTELTSNDKLEKAFDVALHIGTLVAALWYFRRDWPSTWSPRSARSVIAASTPSTRLAWLLLLTAVPGALVGAALAGFIADELGDPILIGINLIVFALVLEWADRSTGARVTDEFHRRDAVIMGIAQALALSPGVSRSGVTISAGRWLQFDRERNPPRVR
jgi:undecaprenyl-diphosphatase UppP